MACVNAGEKLLARPSFSLKDIRKQIEWKDCETPTWKSWSACHTVLHLPELNKWNLRNYFWASLTFILWVSMTVQIRVYHLLALNPQNDLTFGSWALQDISPLLCHSKYWLGQHHWVCGLSGSIVGETVCWILYKQLPDANSLIGECHFIVI